MVILMGYTRKEASSRFSVLCILMPKKGDDRMSAPVDYKTDTEAMVTPAVEEGGKKPPTATGGGKKRWRWFALIALIILIVGGSVGYLTYYLHTTLPANAATMTITPTSQHLTSTYIITAVTKNPDAAQLQIGARQMSSTMTKSVTVKATGHGHQDATYAKGILTFSDLSAPLPVGGYRLAGASGVVVQFWIGVSLPTSVHLHVLAQAQHAGASGNIPAYDIDGQYGTGNVTFYVQNPEPFTDGQDASDYTYVQASDISAPAAGMVNQLTTDTQNAVKKQIQAQEQPVGNIQVTSKTSTNHQVNDKASVVTVTVTATAKGEMYKPSDAQALAMKTLQSDAATKLGSNYVLVGTTIAAPPTIQSIGNDGTITLTVKTEGMWVYHFSNAQLNNMAQSIAGKTQDDALAILSKEQGVNTASIATSGGWGTALPTTPGNISFNVQAVPGIKAT
jgi:hypothetical protein